MQQPDLPTILLVEDNMDDYDALVRSFRKARLETNVAWCKNGREALNYLGLGRVPGADGKPCAMPKLVLMDLNMPGIDGRRTLSYIKQDETLKKIPVVILTTSTDEKDVSYCYETGASSYIQKPVDLDGLLEVARCFKNYWFGLAALPCMPAPAPAKAPG